METFRIVFGLSLVFALFAGCGSEEETPSDSTVQDGGETITRVGEEPIEGSDFAWTWVAFPDSRCRDGSSTGIGVNLNSRSDKVMIYLEGGGACFNGVTCLANPKNYSGSGFAGQSGGVFNRNNGDNPVKDWNFIYVPYCSGDVHAGNSVGNPDGTGDQQFNGYQNMKLFLKRIVPTFPQVNQVLLTGVSAGGFGAALVADLVADAFDPKMPFTLIDDSGPAMSSQYIPACLQRAWRELWGFDSTFLASCGKACPDPDNYAIDWVRYLLTKHKNATGGMISATADGIITIFYGYGQNECQTSFLPTMATDDFKAGLMDLRTQMEDFDNFGTYYIDSATHTWIGADGSFYTTTADGVRLVDWFRGIVEGTSIQHAGP